MHCTYCFRFPSHIVSMILMINIMVCLFFRKMPIAGITYTHNHTQTHINNTHSSTETSIMVEILVEYSITGLLLAAPANQLEQLAGHQYL